MKRGQNITVVRGDSRKIVVTVRDEDTGETRNLIGFDASWIVRRGERDPPLVALTSEDDDRLEVGGSDGTVMLHLDSDLTDLPIRRACHDLVIRGMGENGERGSWTATRGTLTLTR